MEPTEITEITLWTVIILGTIFTMYHLRSEKKKEEGPKEVWVIEDSDADYEFLRMFCHFNNAYMNRFKSADGLFWKFLFSPPDCVIVDYYLEGKITGDKVVSLCKMFNIKHKLITGNSLPIDGVPDRDVIQKGTGREWCNQIQSWFDTEFA